MRISCLGGSAFVMLLAGCASPADMVMAGMCSDQACFDAKREWAEGRAPSPHQMTVEERNQLGEKQGIRPPK